MMTSCMEDMKVPMHERQESTCKFVGTILSVERSSCMNLSIVKHIKVCEVIGTVLIAKKVFIHVTNWTHESNWGQVEAQKGHHASNLF